MPQSIIHIRRTKILTSIIFPLFYIVIVVLAFSSSGFANLKPLDALTWQKLPDYGIDIDVGWDGTIWKIGKHRNVLFKWSDRKNDWVSQSDQRDDFIRLAASRKTNTPVLALVDKNKNIHTYVYNVGHWNRMPGKAHDVAIGYDGKFIIADDRGKVCQWDADNRTWKEIGRSPANIRKVMVVPKGYVYAINKNGQVYKFTDSRWGAWKNDMKDMAVGAAGRVWFLNSSNQLVTYEGRFETHASFSKPDGEHISDITSDENGLPWICTRSGKMYRGLVAGMSGIKRKSAVVVMASIKDSNFRRLFQNVQNKYGQCFKGYDYSLLLKNAYSSPVQPTRHNSNPSPDNLFDSLIELADDGYFMDLYVISHGSPGEINFEHGDVTPAMIRNRLGTGKYAGGKFPLRMVYQMNCWGSDMIDAFKDVGAKVVCGSRQVNFYPNQFNTFVTLWNRGMDFEKAIRESDTQSSRTASHAFLKLDATTNSCFQPKCKFGRTILGNDRTNCAMRYLEDCWNIQAEDCRGDTGIEMINYSSYMLVSGAKNLDKGMVPSW